MWPQLGAPIGFLFANGTFLILIYGLDFDAKTAASDHAFMTWGGWRIPFLASAIMVAVGLYVRLKLTETPVFAKAVQEGKKVKAPLAEVVKSSWRQLIAGTFIMVATYTLFYIVTTWIISYGTGKVTDASGVKLSISYADFLELQLIAVLFFAACVPISGRLADRFGRRSFLIVITAAIIVFGLCFELILDPASMTDGTMLFFLILGMTLMGLTFGPMSAILPELFPTNVRYTGVGHLLQRLVDHRCRGRAVHRDVDRVGLRCRLGRRVPRGRRVHDAHRAHQRPGDQGGRPERGLNHPRKCRGGLGVTSRS